MTTRDYNYIFSWTITYEVIVLVVSGLAAAFIYDEGAIMLIAVLAGTAVLWPCTWKTQRTIPGSLLYREPDASQQIESSAGCTDADAADIQTSQPVFSPRRMTFKSFIVILSFLFLAQNISTYLSLFLDELGVNGALVGLDMSDTDMTVPFILYAALIGPVIEELTFRGFVGRLLLRGGRVLAIFLSALAFGLMHMNIGQLFAGLSIGLVFGYAATEYGLKWSILLHIINNGLLAMLPLLLPEPYQTYALYGTTGLMLILCVFAIYYFIRYNKKFRDYLAENKTASSQWHALFKSIAFWVFVIGYTIFIVIFSFFWQL